MVASYSSQGLISSEMGMGSLESASQGGHESSEQQWGFADASYWVNFLVAPVLPTFLQWRNFLYSGLLPYTNAEIYVHKGDIFLEFWY